MSFFKSLIAYRIGPEWTLPERDALEAELQRLAFRPCEPTQALSLGWQPPRGEEHALFVENVGGHVLLKMAVEKRAVPASAVRSELEARCKALEAERGRKPGKKERSEIKDEIVLTLMPRAFSKRSSMMLWLDFKAGLLVVAAGSHKAGEVAVTQLVEMMAELGHVLPVAPLSTQVAPGTAMGEWLRAQEAPGPFTIDQDLLLKSPEKGSIRYSRHPLDLEEVIEHLDAGLVATEMALTWNDKVTFVFNDGLALRKINFIDVKTDVGEKDKGFDADAAITTGELSKLLPDLIAALGGEMDPAAAAAPVEAAAPAATADEEPVDAPF